MKLMVSYKHPNGSGVITVPAEVEATSFANAIRAIVKDGFVLCVDGKRAILCHQITDIELVKS